MSLSRRTLALLLVPGMALTGCVSSSNVSEPAGDREAHERPDDTGDEPPRDGARAEQAPPVWDPAPASVAAIGDSITTGFDACSLLADCPEVSWATGTNETVRSVANRLGATSVWNEAVAGSVMADLPDQARQAAAWDPDLVTVLMGANDACTPTVEAMTDIDSFAADFRAALGIIRDEAPEAQVFVASLPDLERLWATGKDSGMARMAWQFGICPSMLADPVAQTQEAQDRRAAVQQRVSEYNEVLREVCETDALCRHDQGVVAEYAFGVDELSDWDWFHPGQEGQRVLAELAHQEITRP